LDSPVSNFPKTTFGFSCQYFSKDYFWILLSVFFQRLLLDSPVSIFPKPLLVSPVSIFPKPLLDSLSVFFQRLLLDSPVSIFPKPLLDSPVSIFAKTTFGFSCQ